MNKMRNCHSPAGMGYSSAGTRNVKLLDCPKCKFGTVDLLRGEGKAVCADCRAEFPIEAFNVTAKRKQQ